MGSSFGADFSKAETAPRESPEDAATIMASPNPYVFLVGCPRSGTTLLKRMFDAHRSIAVPEETHWIVRFVEKGVGVSPEGMVTSELLPTLFEYHRFGDLGLSRDDVSSLVPADGRISYADFVSRLLDLYGRARSKPLVGDKTPSYVRRIGLLHGLWPSARFIHIIRDGRDVCLSVLSWDKYKRASGRHKTWDEDPVTTTALWWEWMVRLGREAETTLPAHVYEEVKYEELVLSPEAQCRRLCRAIGLDFDIAMLAFHTGKRREDPALSAKQAWLPPTQGLRDWRTQMTPGDQERFEAASGALLDELGYERAVSHPSAAALEHAQRLRARFDGRPLPASW